MKVRLTHWTHALLVLTLVVFSGCRPAPDVPEGRAWMDFVEALTDFQSVASVPEERWGFRSTSDPQGGNNDFNNFEGSSQRNPGWVVLADIEGPGVIDRFWTTGMDYGHPIKIYIDGERHARLEGAVDELFGHDRQPFIYPFAGHINQCWWTYIPITFNERIEIETPAPPVHPHWGQRRFYFQVNYRLFDEAVESFPRDAARGRVTIPSEWADVWLDALNIYESLSFEKPGVELKAGESALLFSAEGENTLPGWSLNVEPADPELGALARNSLLQDCLVRVYYDGLEEPSFSVPLGDLFAGGWRKRKLSSFALSSLDDGFVWRLPKPFRQSIRMELVNDSEHDVVVDFDAQALTERRPDQGYLHGIWNRTGPEMRGRPHRLVELEGRGRFVGCYVGVTARDQSWWILEGDEYLQVDGWQFSGTGAEDYFNGGWYYRGASFTPVSGILDRYPFRVGQYRFHLFDSYYFDREFRMDFERGDQNVSFGWLRSAAFLYLTEPQGVPDSVKRTDRAAADNPFESYSLMVQLFELERSYDFWGAIHLIDEWLERYPETEYAGVLLLRRLEYERHLGEPVTDADYEPFLAGAHGDRAREQAQLLTWFYEKPDRYLVGACINAGGTVSLGDRILFRRFHPLQLNVAGIELPAGTHILKAEVTPIRGRAWPWVQMAVRGHKGLAATGPHRTKVMRDRGAERPDLNDVMRGPPHDETYVNAQPNAFILMQSVAFGIRAGDWDWHMDPATMKVEFDTERLEEAPFMLKVLGLPPPPAR